MVAENAVFAHHGVGVGKEVAAGLYAGIENDVGQQRGTGAQPDP